VETTPVPLLIDVPADWDLSSLPENIQSSIESRLKRPQGGTQQTPAEQRIYFSQLAALISAVLNPFLPASTLTVTSTSTRTSTVTSLTTSTGTMFIQGCTPPNFPYSSCSMRK
jgi:hypothetical protein